MIARKEVDILRRVRIAVIAVASMLVAAFGGSGWGPFSTSGWGPF
jgi:hypothetical protein